MEDVIVFGHGRYYRSKEVAIKKMYNIIAFIDNAIKVDAITFDNGIPIYNPNRINDLPKITVVIMSAKYFEMTNQLAELGVDDSRIRFALSVTPFYDNVEKLFHDYQCKIRVEEGNILISCAEKSFSFKNEEDYKVALRKLVFENDPYVKLIKDMPLNPLSRRFGLEFGKAVDRFYIEKFLNENRKSITGDVMEIAENTYTNMFGENVRNAFSLHINGWGEKCIKGNLETGEGIIDHSVDCLICTQTLEHILNTKEVIKNIYKILKKDGVALITVASIKQISLYDYYNWGEYWHFTKQSVSKILTEVFDEEKVEVFSYGNLKTVTAMLYGVCQEELEKEDLEYNDEQYPLVIAAKVQK